MNVNLPLIAVLLYCAVLFAILTPGALFTVPPRATKWVIISVHAAIFAVVYCLTHKYVWALAGGKHQ